MRSPNACSSLALAVLFVVGIVVLRANSPFGGVIAMIGTGVAMIGTVVAGKNQV